jgi:hypothetical protein
MYSRSRFGWLLAPCVLLAAMPARAEMIGTDQLLSPSTDAQRAGVEAFLAREDVRRQLEAYGVDPADAAGRAAALTGAELQTVVARIDSLPAGAGVTTLELILIILLIVILI